jgi:hypothetical protein
MIRKILLFIGTVFVTVVVLLALPLRMGSTIAYVGSIVSSGIFYCRARGSHIRNSPLWVRIALRMVAASALLWGLVGLVVVFGQDRLSFATLQFLRYPIKSVCAGVGLGILLLLVISGELFRLSPNVVDESRSK